MRSAAMYCWRGVRYFQEPGLWGMKNMAARAMSMVRRPSKKKMLRHDQISAPWAPHFGIRLEHC